MYIPDSSPKGLATFSISYATRLEKHIGLIHPDCFCTCSKAEQKSVLAKNARTAAATNFVQTSSQQIVPQKQLIRN